VTGAASRLSSVSLGIISVAILGLAAPV